LGKLMRTRATVNCSRMQDVQMFKNKNHAKKINVLGCIA
jgi:hypothetical protein